MKNSKKLLIWVVKLTLTCVLSIIIIACSKDDNTPAPLDISIYEGTWSGTYSGDASGTWTFNVTGNGSLRGSWISSDQSTSGTSEGIVFESGSVSQDYSNGGTGTGQLNAETGVFEGVWQDNDPNNPEFGTLTGTKE